jgi:hypothetical protein
VAFSGDKTWSVTRDDVISAALRKIAVYDAADGIPAQELTNAATALNALIKEWAGEGLAIWLRQKTILILNYGQPYYWLGPNPTNDTTNRIWHKAYADTEHKENTITADLAAAATVVSVTDANWIDANRKSANKPAASDQIGIRLDDSTMWWTTASAVGVSNQITLTSGIPAGRTAASGSRIYSFLVKTSRPVRCLQAIRSNTDGIDNEIQLIGRNDYERLTQKTSSGEPNQVCFESFITQQTSNALHSVVRVWPAKHSTSVDKIILITEHYPDDLDNPTENPQFPAEWSNALIWGLAEELSFEYGVDPSTRAQISNKAAQKKAMMFASSDIENAPVSFGVEAQ